MGSEMPSLTGSDGDERSGGDGHMDMDMNTSMNMDINMDMNTDVDKDKVDNVKAENVKDEELVKRARNGEEYAFEEILERYKKIVSIKSRAFFMAGGDPDDIIQEGMIGLFKAVRDFDENREASFNSFAQMCVERQMITAIKSASSQKNTPLNTSVPMEEAQEESWGEPVESPEDIIIDRETAESMEAELRELLSPFESEIFDMLLKDRNYVEIAEILGVDKKAADNGIQRIKRKMKILKGDQNQR